MKPQRILHAFGFVSGDRDVHEEQGSELVSIGSSLGEQTMSWHLFRVCQVFLQESAQAWLWGEHGSKVAPGDVPNLSLG